MGKKRVVPVWISVILLLLCAVSIVAVIAMFTYATGNKISTIVTCVFCLCAVVLAVIYCFMGYKKSTANFFTAFSVVLALLVLLQANHYMTSVSAQQGALQNVAVEELQAPPAEDRSTPTGDAAQMVPDVDTSAYSHFIQSIGISDRITLMVLVFGMLVTLTVAKDLGKKKSYWLAGLSTALSFISAISALIRVFARFSGRDLAIRSFSAGCSIEFSIFILCAIYGIMVYAKYQDKAARGTK